MSALTDRLDLASLHLSSGQGRRLEPAVSIDPFELGGERYLVASDPLPIRLDVSRTTAEGYSLRLRFEASLSGPCMRCLEPASPSFSVDAWEVEQPAGGEELSSPYVTGAILALRGWARDSLALALPAQVLCRPGCAGLCPVCGADLNAAGPEHRHEAGPDPRWAKLSELEFD